MLDNEVCVVILIILSLYIFTKIFFKIIYPTIVEKCTENIEVNPKWLTPKLREQYYGFHDIDIILVRDPFNQVPRFRKSKDKTRLEVLFADDMVSVKDIDHIAQIILAGKIKIRYNFWFPEKPAYWLSILCYMLDGGDIEQKAVSWEEKDKKPIDDNCSL